jgi:pimeloyl-ACP methyl ester carboxylesterase
MGVSCGAFITLLLAAARPELVRGIIVHEPPWWSVLDDSSPEAAAVDAMTPLLAEILERITAGDHAGAAKQFATELLLGPGGWTHLPEDVRDGMIANAPTVPDELNDPEPWSADKSGLARTADRCCSHPATRARPSTPPSCTASPSCCRRLSTSSVPAQATSPG